MITISVPVSAFSHEIDELQRRMGNLLPVMASIGVELEGRVANRFETRTDPQGQAWAAWSDAYAANYPKDGRRKILERYGDLIHSLNSKPDSKSVRVGFGVPYLAYHEFGSDDMPRRGVLFANPKTSELGAGDEQAIDDLLQDWLDGVFD